MRLPDAQECNKRKWVNQMSDEGKAIAELRHKAGLTQKACAEYLGIPKRTLENWEGGRRIPNAFVFNAVKDKLTAKKEG